METLVLYCKSYNNDVLRAKTLAESIQRFNADHIPFYVSVPTDDMELFTEQLKGLNCTLMRDEELLA
jgi:hypothetical protein